MLVLPRLSFRAGVLATAATAFVGVFGIPAAYSSFGEGPELVRAAVTASSDIARECGVPSTFVLVPWRLSIQDSDRQGRLELQYWFRCGSSVGSASGKYHHTGGAWVADALTARVEDRQYNLIARTVGRSTP